MAKSVLILGNFLSGVAGTYSPGETLAKLLAKSGWRVCTASDKTSRAYRLMDMLAAVWRRRRAYSVAYVEVYSGPAFFWAEAVCAALQLVRKPFVLALHGGGLPGFAHRWQTRVRRLLQSAQAVTAPSGYLQEAMQPWRPDLSLVPNSLDLKAYHFRLRPQPRPRFIWLRAFHRVYNPMLAPKVAALLKPDFPELQLIMVGPDKGDGSLAATRQVSRALKVSDHIRIVGQVPKPEVPAWMASGDIFLNTTNVDNNPVSVLEAMASGLCVVSTDVGGIPYFLRHENEALLVPPDDPVAMAEAIKRLIREPDLAEHISRNARHKAEQFDCSVVLPQWEALLTQVAQGRKH